MDLKNGSMKMKPLYTDVTGKTVLNKELRSVGLTKIREFKYNRDVTGKTVLDMDFLNLSMKTEKQKQLKNM